MTQPDWSIDLPIAPDAVAARITRAINLPKKRLFGLLKTQAEFIGLVDAGRFEIWERQARAVHAVGQLQGVRGGTKVEAWFVVGPRTRVLLVIFFVLYALAAFGIAAQGVHGLSPTSLVIAAAGSLVIAAIFVLAARSQREQLRAFLERTLARES